MIYDRILPMIQNRLGMRTDLQSVIKTEIDLAQRELENREELPWFLKKTWVVQNDLVTSVAQPYITKDNDFLLLQDRENSVRVIQDDGVQIPLRRMSHQSMLVELSKETSLGLPTRFSESEDRIYVGMPPDKQYQFSISCYRRELARASMPDNKNLQTNAWYKYASELLIWATVYNVAVLIEHEGKAKLAGQMREGKYRELLNRSTAQEEAARLRELSPDPEYGNDR